MKVTEKAHNPKRLLAITIVGEIEEMHARIHENALFINQ